MADDITRRSSVSLLNISSMSLTVHFSTMYETSEYKVDFILAKTFSNIFPVSKIIKKKLSENPVN